MVHFVVPRKRKGMQRMLSECIDSDYTLCIQVDIISYFCCIACRRMTWAKEAVELVHNISKGGWGLST